MLKLISHLLIASFIFAFAHSSLAATVSQVKGNRVLINLEGDSAAVGDKVYLLNANGKRVAIVNLTSVKGEKAIGTVSKGKAQAGFSAQVADASAAPSEPRSTVVKNQGGGNSKISIGGIGGFSSQSMKLKAQYLTTSEDVTLTGTSMSFKVLGDYRFSDLITIRATAGYAPFSTKGSTSANICNSGTSTSCEVTFTYLTADGTAQIKIFSFGENQSRVWAGIGYALMLEMGKSVNVPNLNSSGKTNQMLLISGGLDYAMGSDGSYIPVTIEMGMFQGSSNVTASSMTVSAGYAFKF